MKTITIDVHKDQAIGMAYIADIIPLPGRPYIGYGYTPIEAIVSVLDRNKHREAWDDYQISMIITNTWKHEPQDPMTAAGWDRDAHPTCRVLTSLEALRGRTVKILLSAFGVVDVDTGEVFVIEED